MKSLLLIAKNLLLLCAFVIFISNSGKSQSQDNYFDEVQEWESYFDQHPELVDPPSHEYKVFMRWQAFWNNRILSADSAISGTPKVIQDAMNFYKDHYDHYNKVASVGADWKLMGPYYTSEQKSGLVSAVWVDTAGDPTFNTIYIGTNSSGVWKTTNDGIDWVNMTDRSGFNLIGVSDIKGDPYNANILYVASGGENFGRTYSYSIGILRTEDGGENWEIIYGLEPNQETNVNCLLLDPTNTNILYAGVRDMLIRLTKNGSIWTKDIIDTMPKEPGWNPLEYRNIRDIEMKPGSPDTLYVATDNKFWAGHRKAQIWRITGARSSNPSMQQLDTLLPSVGVLHTERFELAVTPQYPDWIYAQASYFHDNQDTIIVNNDTIKGWYFAIWRSKDAGNSWERKYQEWIKNTWYYGTSLMGCGRIDYFKSLFKNLR